MRKFFGFVTFVIFWISCKGYSKEGLTIWVSYNDEEFKVFSEIVKEFEKNENIKINVQRVPFEGMLEKILTSVIAGQNPDISRLDIAQVYLLAKKGILAELDTNYFRDVLRDLYEAPLKSSFYKGKLYGIPDQITCILLFYNKKLFAEKGLDSLKPPSTWDEFLEYAKKLTDHKKQIYGFGMRNTLWWDLPFFYTFGSEVFDEQGNPLFTEESFKEALLFKRDIYLKHKVEGGAFLEGAVNPDMGFINEKYAMIFSGPWKIKSLKDINFPFGIALIPKGKAGSFTALGGTQMVIFKNSKNKEKAMKFLKYIISEEAQLKWSNTLGQIPVNKKVVNKINLRENKIMETLIRAIESTKPRAPIAEYPEVERIYIQEVYPFIKGEKEIEEVQNNLQNRIKKLLEEN
ncbi:MAG: extracellular solute-binding protein [Candidatus Hydrothermales bacterium]